MNEMTGIRIVINESVELDVYAYADEYGIEDKNDPGNSVAADIEARLVEFLYQIIADY